MLFLTCTKAQIKIALTALPYFYLCDVNQSIRTTAPFLAVTTKHAVLCKRQPTLKEVPQGGDVRPGRSELIKSAFHVLNQSGSGHLSAAEMKPFAEHTGVLPAFLEMVVVCWSLSCLGCEKDVRISSTWNRPRQDFKAQRRSGKQNLMSSKRNASKSHYVFGLERVVFF